MISLTRPSNPYGCELWGIRYIDILERIQLKFYKQTLNLKKITPSNMIYGELGVIPSYIDFQTRIISFWTKLVDSPIKNKLSSKVYRVIYEMHDSNKVTSPWIKLVKYLLCSMCFPVISYSQGFVNANWLVKAVNQKLKDVFIQSWKLVDCAKATNEPKSSEFTVDITIVHLVLRQFAPLPFLLQ